MAFCYSLSLHSCIPPVNTECYDEANTGWNYLEEELETICCSLKASEAICSEFLLCILPNPETVPHLINTICMLVS